MSTKTTITSNPGFRPADRRKLRGLLACLGAAGLAFLAEGVNAQALPPVIKVALVKEFAGNAGFAGLSMKKGIELAAEEVNNSGFLGRGVKLVIDPLDTASVTQTAVSLVSQSAAKPEYVAILGPSNSDAGAATAPIAQRARIPMIFSQSLGDGILVGNYIFRVSSPLDAYYGLVMDYLKSKNVKTVSMLYNASSIRQAQAAKEMLPDMAKPLGISILSNTGVPITSTDFTALASKIVSEKSDAAVFYMAGAQHVTAVQQLTRAGYKGLLIAGSGIETSLKSLDKSADGLVWVAPFHNVWQNPGAAKFSKAYQEKFSEVPLSYAAEGYDSVWLLARGIKASGSATRDGIQKGMSDVVKTGFDGAQGHLSFVGNDARTKGVLMQWSGGKEVVLRRGDQ